MPPDISRLAYKSDKKRSLRHAAPGSASALVGDGSVSPLAQFRADYLQTVIDYHENIRQYHQDLLRIKDSFNNDVAAQAWHHYYRYYKDEIDAHFKFEEAVLFEPLESMCTPGSVYDADNVQKDKIRNRVARYRQGHKIIRGEGAGILRFFRENKDHLYPAAREEIFRRLKKLSLMSFKHADVETRNLVPLCEKDTLFRFLAGKAFLNYVSDYKEKYRKKSIKEKKPAR